MTGALGCTACPRGSYMDPQTAACLTCPFSYWWQADFLAACTPVQDSPATSAADFFRFQELALYYAYFFNKYKHTQLDFVSTASVLIADAGRPPPYQTFPASDYLGRLWTTTSPFFPTPLHSNPDQCVPGIWALCAAVAGPQAPCHCWFSIPLSFDYFDVDGQLQASTWSRRMAGQHSLFAFRANTRHLPTLHHLTASSSFIDISANQSTEGDTGMCYVGWPAQCDCVDKTYYWSLSNAECLPCPPNTVVPSHSMFECLPVSDSNPLCTNGTFLYYATPEALQECRGCPPNTFSDTNMASECKPKRVQTCPPDTYLHLTDATRDNECRPCLPCSIDSQQVPLESTCPGGTITSPAYICITWARPIAGFVIGQWPSYTACPTPPPLHSQWAVGPHYGLCYFACQYGLLLALEYPLLFALEHPASQQQNDGSNLFSYFPTASDSLRMAANRVCAPCNRTECPTHMWRPLWQSGCGAPCLLSPAHCPLLELGGCVPLCEIPPHAHYVDLSTCDWACDYGWFRAREVSTVDLNTAIFLS